ncbi:MAG: discoidin domain-containing protein, partial [Acholeplasmataceae bacterium]|nr:discoidin domain-containing protein [Acholeplasmataceae bacterium]
MKKTLLIFILIAFIILSSCKKKEAEEDSIVLEPCTSCMADTQYDEIQAIHILIPYSETKGNLANFINLNKPHDEHPLFFLESIIRTHQVILSFDAIYPIDTILWTSYLGERAETITSVSVDYSINGLSFSRVHQDFELNTEINTIPMGGSMAKSIRFTFQADDKTTHGIQDVRFVLGEGFIVKEDTDWSNTFLRYQGWTGADGIFSFNLTNGDDQIGAAVSHTGFIFSDTFVGSVSPNNNLRGTSRIINNSLGYLDHQKDFSEAFAFEYALLGGVAESIALPGVYLGKRARHLLDGDGLSISQSKDALLTHDSDGTMWLAEDENPELIIDFGYVESPSKLYLWNYNDDIDYGIQAFTLFHSHDGSNWTQIGNHSIPKASGSNNEPYTLEVLFDAVETRYLRLLVTDGYSEDYVGLGKMMVFNAEDQFLFGQITTTSEMMTPTPHELTSRLWLQDGIVIGDNLYVFPILIKDEADFFKVHNVGMMKMPIENHKIMYTDTTYFSSPLQVKTPDGGTIFMGAGVMNNIENDGYIYIYGYKDLAGRFLVVGRCLPEDIEHFNRWTYYDGETWTRDINQVAPRKEAVSAELSCGDRFFSWCDLVD